MTRAVYLSTWGWAMLKAQQALTPGERALYLTVCADVRRRFL